MEEQSIYVDNINKHATYKYKYSNMHHRPVISQTAGLNRFSDAVKQKGAAGHVNRDSVETVDQRRAGRCNSCQKSHTVMSKSSTARKICFTLVESD